MYGFYILKYYLCLEYELYFLIYKNMKYNDFTIAFEIELESDDNNIIIPEYFFNTLPQYGKQDISESHNDEKIFLEKTRKYAINKIKENLPNFYIKYNNILNYTFDKTLKKGIEIVNKTYFNGITDALTFLSDFYSDFNKQKFWYMNNNTALHINIGFDRPVKWNIVKGLLFIDDEYIFKGMNPERRFKYKNLLDDLDINKVTEKQVFDKVKKYGPKAFNLNILRIKNNNYAEFRYIGGKVDFDFVKERLFYFCKVVDIMTK